jgi:hypothetical protein
MTQADGEFALLSCRTRNIGDYIQVIAARQFLPRVDVLADRDRLCDFQPRSPTKLICNGWFGYASRNMFFHENVNPLLISLHISQQTNLALGGSPDSFADALRNVEAVRHQFKRFSPVGARDLATLKLLEDLGIQAYFSGCLTLALERDESLARGDAIVLCDVPQETASRLSKITARPVIVTQHSIERALEPGDCLAAAGQLLTQYQTAHLVITTRLHCALPCLAYGTPVIFLQPELESTRFAGLSGLMKTIPLCDSHLLGRADIDTPSANSPEYQSLRDKLIERVAGYIQKSAVPVAMTAYDELQTSRAMSRYFEQQAVVFRSEAGYLRARVEYWRARSAAFENSSSWKITAPLRAAKRWFVR